MTVRQKMELGQSQDTENVHTELQQKIYAPAQNGTWRELSQMSKIIYFMDIIYEHAFKDYIITMLLKLSQSKDRKFPSFIYESNITSILSRQIIAYKK